MPGYYEILGQEDYDEIDDLSLVEELLGEEYLIGQMRHGLPRLPGRRAAGRAPARRAVPRASRGALASALAQRKAAEGVLVREAAPSKGSETIMGMVSAAAIVAGAAGNATSTPQELFRPTRFTVPASIAPNFTLTDLRIGVTSQFVSVDAIPCEALQEGSYGMGLKWDTAQVNNNVTANVVNIGPANLFFRACVHGTSAK